MEAITLTFGCGKGTTVKFYAVLENSDEPKSLIVGTIERWEKKSVYIRPSEESRMKYSELRNYCLVTYNPDESGTLTMPVSEMPKPVSHHNYMNGQILYDIDDKQLLPFVFSEDDATVEEFADSFRLATDAEINYWERNRPSSSRCINYDADIRERMRALYQTYNLSEPKDVGCKTPNEMQQKMADEIMAIAGFDYKSLNKITVVWVKISDSMGFTCLSGGYNEEDVDNNLSTFEANELIGKGCEHYIGMVNRCNYLTEDVVKYMAKRGWERRGAGDMSNGDVHAYRFFKK